MLVPFCFLQEPETADAVPAEEIKNNIVEEENNDDDDDENVGRPVFYNE